MSRISWKFNLSDCIGIKLILTGDHPPRRRRTIQRLNNKLLISFGINLSFRNGMMMMKTSRSIQHKHSNTINDLRKAETIFPLTCGGNKKIRGKKTGKSFPRVRIAADGKWRFMDLTIKILFRCCCYRSE